MTQLAIADFLDYLRRSRLLDEQRLELALTEIEKELGPSRFAETEAVSEALIAKKLLTVWQVRQLLKKRYKGFYLRQYRILSHLGVGGMSTVYLAEHSIMQRRVAIKVLPKKKLEKSQYLDRFIREAQTIASLDHPNIIRAYDIDREDDVHYIVMEYFDGRNLQDAVDQDGALPFEVAADYARQAALALQYAHQAGVVHRDVKPGNLLVNQQGLVKVLDLGLALLDERVFEGRLTSLQEDKILGTADYLAPEQGIDSHQVDARADIYGLGGVLYFCLTGHAPFPTGTVAQRLLAHQNMEPRSVFQDRPDAPDDLVRLCQKMMSKKPENRQQSALEVVADMQHWLIVHGFANETDFPPLETLRATPETLGAVPIPSQAERLRQLSGELQLIEQGIDAESPFSLDFGNDPGTVSPMVNRGNASSLGLYDLGALANGLTNGLADGLSGGSAAVLPGSSTVSGMMRSPMRNENLGVPTKQDAMSKGESGTSSTQESHHEAKGGFRNGVPQQQGGRAARSSGLLQKPGQPAVPAGVTSGIIVDDDDELTYSGKRGAAAENDPFLFALDEMKLDAKSEKIESNTQQTHIQQSHAPQSYVAQSNKTESQPTMQQTMQQINLASAKKMQAANGHNGETAQNAVDSNNIAFDTSPWYKTVPIWFWFLFSGSVVSTIFLAGILAAVLFGAFR